MNIRRFNEQGLQKFGWFLDSLTTEEPAPWPGNLLTENESTGPPLNVNVESRSFSNRLEASAYLFEKLSILEDLQIERDKGLWAWLALYYFEQLCIKDRKGKYNPGARSRWIPDPGNFRRYYRHLLAGPYLIYRAHKDKPQRALVLLCGSLDAPGDVTEQLASRLEIVTNNIIIETATQLYVDKQTQKLKRGAASKGGGSARRFISVLEQFDLTWDFSIMETEDLLNMLPKEFDKFRIENDNHD